MPEHPQAPEQRTIDVDVQDVDTRGRTLHGYAAVYGVESADLGGFTERIAPGAFGEVLRSSPDVRGLLNHDPSSVLGRTRSGTLRLADDERGLRFELDLPDSPLGENVRASVARGDIDGASFRFRVGRDSWEGNRRTVEQVAELQDVTVATFGAYPAASVELRTRNPATGQEEPKVADQAEQNTETADAVEQNTEDRSQRAGGLRVEDRAVETRVRGLADEFRSRGFPGETASMSWTEYEQRAVTFTGSVDPLNPLRREGAGLGHDQRFIYPVLPVVPVEAGTTAVQVVRQTARAVAAPGSMNRPLTSTAAKPETGSTLAIVTESLRQVASVQSGIPNVYMEQPVMTSIIENDLRLALAEALDAMAVAAVAGSPFTAPGTDPLLVAIRRAITAIQADGYNPDTLVLRPQDAEALDVLTSGNGASDFVFGPAQFAPGQLFGLNRRVSKAAAAPIVLDSTAFARLHIAPVSLARFEENSGSTNSSLVRLETHAVVGVERANAARRIAAA